MTPEHLDDIDTRARACLDPAQTPGYTQRDTLPVIEAVSGLIAEVRKLRAQVDELIPWAMAATAEACNSDDFAQGMVDEVNTPVEQWEAVAEDIACKGYALYTRVRFEGEFGERHRWRYGFGDVAPDDVVDGIRVWSSTERQVIAALRKRATPFPVSTVDNDPCPERDSTGACHCKRQPYHEDIDLREQEED